MSLMKKLSIGFLFAVLGSLVLASIISNTLVGKEFKKYLVDEHKTKVNNAVHLITELYNEQASLTDLKKEEIQRYAVLQELYIEINDSNGNKLYSSGEGHLQHKSMMESMMGPMMHRFNEMNIGSYTEEKFPLLVGYKNIGTITVGYFGTSYLSTGSVTFMRTLNHAFLLSAVIALLFGFIISVIISRQLSKPLVQITDTANKIREGHLESKASLRTNTKEVAELSHSINYLAETLKNQEMLRKRLTSDMAHELRTPLTTLKTHVEAFMDGIWEPTTERLAVFYEEINRLAKLVDNLRDLAKLEQTTLHLSKSTVDISSELQKLIDTFKPLYMKGNYQLVSNIPEGIFAIVDKDKFLQIMHNLLLNSYKYLTPNGKAEVILKKENQMILIKVIDNGIGIPSKDLPHIFERFYRSDLSRDKNTGGSGIGLTITKAFVEAHGGKIYATSELNKGTIFTVELPCMLSK